MVRRVSKGVVGEVGLWAMGKRRSGGCGRAGGEEGVVEYEPVRFKCQLHEARAYLRSLLIFYLRVPVHGQVVVVDVSGQRHRMERMERFVS